MAAEKCRILSIDGGGLRGVIPAQILLRTTNYSDPACSKIKDWLEKTDVFAGTSTGGIIALALAADINVAKIHHLYMEKGGEIFEPPLGNTPLSKAALSLKSFVWRAYSNTNLSSELEKVFGELTLGDLAEKNRRVIVTAFSLDDEMLWKSVSSDGTCNPDPIRTWKPKIFHNFDNEDGIKNHSLKLSTLALYTSAGPTYLPSVDGYIDGGVFANNPSMIALAQVLDGRNEDAQSRENLLDSVALLSLGTGRSNQYIEGSTVNYGEVKWASPLIDIMFESVSEVPNFQCKQFLQDNYWRHQVYLGSKPVELDNSQEVPRMNRIAQNEDLAKLIDWIKNKWV